MGKISKKIFFLVILCGVWSSASLAGARSVVDPKNPASENPNTGKLVVCNLKTAPEESQKRLLPNVALGCRCKVSQCKLSFYTSKTADPTVNIGTTPDITRDNAAFTGYVFTCVEGASHDNDMYLGLYDTTISQACQGPYGGNPSCLEPGGVYQAFEREIQLTTRDQVYLGIAEGLYKGYRDGSDGGAMTVFVNTASTNPLDYYLTPGSICVLSDEGYAYWYNPLYFRMVDSEFTDAKGRCGQSGPILTSTDLFGNKVTGTSTFFGCLPNSPNGLAAFIVRLVTGLAIFVTSVIIAVNIFIAMTRANIPDQVKAARKRIITAFITLFGMIFGIVILDISGVTILGIDTFAEVFAIFFGN